MHDCAILAIILSFVCPPLAVLLVDGCGGALCANICLTIFFFIPGLIHSWFVICSDPPQAQTIVVQQAAPAGQHNVVVNNNAAQPQPQVPPVIVAAPPPPPPVQAQPVFYPQPPV